MITVLWAVESGVQLISRQEISVFSKTFRLAGGTSQSHIQWELVTQSPGVMWLKCEDDHSPPSSVKVKNG